MKKAKNKVAALVLSFLLLFAVAVPVLAAELPLMPMMIMGKSVDKNGSDIAEGTLKVFVGDKLVTEAPIRNGQVDVTLDAADKNNLSTIDRGDLGKTVHFDAVLDGKEYDAVAAKEITFQEGVLEGSDSRLLITVNFVSTGSGQQSGGSSGVASGGQSATQTPAAPVANPVAGTYAKSIKVELSSSTAQSVIYYTTDNTDPGSSATRKEYKEPLSIEKDTVLKVVSYKNNLYSTIVVLNYLIKKLEQNGSVGGSSAVQLSDLQGHWAAAVIQKMVQQGIVAGYEDKTFRPDNPISRVECAAIIARALTLDSVDPSLKRCGSCVNASNIAKLAGFSDAADIPEWARGSVAAAVYAGLLKGYPGTEGKSVFLPQKQITRVELAAILARVVTSKSGQQTAQEAEFTDSQQIPEWAAEAVDLAAQKGLIKGYPNGTFQPQKSVTRAEATAMIDRLLDSMK